VNRLLVATRSAGKQAEFRRLLADLPFTVVFPDDIELTELPEENDLEMYDTFEANARAKARWFQERSGLATLADDSGLEVAALGGAPGVRSRRYSGVSGPEGEVSRANNTALLAALALLSDTDRKARYRCALVLLRPDSDEIVTYGVTQGSIASAPRGVGGFGYDPLFYSAQLRKTLGEASAAEKESVSHRAQAVAALIRQVQAGERQQQQDSPMEPTD
jgi:XTP/dITP diphosphohydrolase